MSDRNELLNGSISLEVIAEFLDEFFTVEVYCNDQNGIYCPSNRSIKRLGIALEPWRGLADWVSTYRLDALFLHRPWTIQPKELPSDLGILSYHKAFDECLTLGFNSRLAAAVGLSKLEVLGYKEGRAIGMLGEISEQPFEIILCARIKSIFGGYEQISLPGQNAVSRLAIVGAMNEMLVREADQRGVQVYITGQWRQPANSAVTETGIGVIAVGHRRAEEWGLRALAGVLRERWTHLEVFLPRFAIALLD